MTSPDNAHHGTAVLRKYKSIGLFGGLFLGALAGIMVAGPHFGDWGSSRITLTMVGTTLLGGLIGYIAGEIALARQATGCAPGVGSGASPHSDGPSCGGGAEGGDE